MDYEAVIGLEVHAQLKTQSKIFCGCSTAFGAPANTHTCPVCLGMPGVLPVLNRKVVEYTMRMALATHCTIARESRFARKNYFYPDLPKGYQISQYEMPLAEKGHLEVESAGGRKRIGITRIHMEEDAGKLSHDPLRPRSRVDFNRTGVPLIEIVSDPDMRTPQEAGAYLRQLHAILRYLDICDGNMEEGSFRCDANVSLRPKGSRSYGIRTELKNMNSFKNVEKALDYEMERQRMVLEDGGEVVQETRLWDAETGHTVSMRGKEEAHDYRYFPDPDLLPLVLDDAWIEKVRQALPELPDAKKSRFVGAYGLSQEDAQVMTSTHELACYFEACVSGFPQPKQVCNWVMGPLLGMLNARGLSIDKTPVQPSDLVELLVLMDQGVISGRMAKSVFEQMAAEGKSPRSIVEAKGLSQVSDAEVIGEAVTGILTDHPQEVADYKKGKTKLLGFFVGQVMKRTGGKANPAVVNELLRKKLEQD